jgi:acyl-CoA thioester hydrolase
VDLRVRFAETDQMGVAHHAAYVVWLEAARVEWLRGHGLSYRDLETEGVSLAVTSVDVAYRSAARFDDLLRIEVTLEEARTRRLRFAYRVLQVDDGRVVATAHTVHVPTAPTGAAMRLPRRWLAAVGTLRDATATTRG